MMDILGADPVFLKCSFKFHYHHRWPTATSKADIVASADILAVFSTRLPRVYPVYSIHWRKSFRAAMERLLSLDTYIPVGKMGLFLHCNIDHAMHMGTLAARHIISGNSSEKWFGHVERFHEYTVRN